MAYRNGIMSGGGGGGGGMMAPPRMSSPIQHPSMGLVDPNNNGGDHTFLMEHLATFPIDRESPSGVVYAADGMRKLLQLEKTTGIWSQRMDICLLKRKQLVQIIDHETKNIIENFPIEWIGMPTPFKNNDPTEMYNNIVVFTVEPPASARSGRSSAEMHIFQCRNVDAGTLCEYLNMMKQGYGHHSEVAPDNDRRSMVQENNNNNVAKPVALKKSTTNNQQTFADQYERDVHVLNYCFDDIEKFIARLHHLAMATKEIERRRRLGSRSSYNGAAGEGMLSMRARPPSESDFLDIFAKFKLSFNLLAKLKAYIHDPNAPELVHFLFTPLALIVDAAKDITGKYGPHRHESITALVITPFFTNGTVNLLSNCVTSRESELWKSLGDPWTLTRQQLLAKYKNLEYQDFHPVFFDGYSPDFALVFEDEPELEPQRARRSSMSSPIEKAFAEFNDMGDDTESIDSIEQRHFPAAPPNGEAEITVWLRSLELRNAKVVRVTYPRTANNDKELTVTRGEILEIVDDSRKWWRARNINGQLGFVPHTIVTRYNVEKSDAAVNGGDLAEEDMDDVFQNPVYSRTPSKSYRESVVSHHHRMSSNVSSFAAPSPPPMTPPPAKQPNHHMDMMAEIRSREVQEERQMAPPPPPMPPLSIPTTPILRPARSEPVTPKAMQSPEAYGMQEELKHVLSAFRDNRRNLEIVRTPNVYIQQSASQAEVQHWLRAKGFSEAIITRLQNLNGTQLFALQRKQLEEICGVEEGRRMHSQITIQRNVSGYQTARSSELRAILAKARQKMESPSGEPQQQQQPQSAGYQEHYD